MAAGKRVDFLIAGAQKAGTTALFDYLSDMPELELPRVKEAHFFDDEERVDWNAPDYGAYHALFDDPARLWGEATPITLYWPNALERVRAYNPAMKLVLLFRDPVQRAWSHWKMEYARGKEREPFAWCIREGRARMAEGTPYPGFNRVYSYVERGFYGRQLARVLDLFPGEQVLLLSSERLLRHSSATLEYVRRFLCLGPRQKETAARQSRVAADILYPSRLEEEDVAFLHRTYADELERFYGLARKIGQPVNPESV